MIPHREPDDGLRLAIHHHGSGSSAVAAHKTRGRRFQEGQAAVGAQVTGDVIDR